MISEAIGTALREVVGEILLRIAVHAVFSGFASSSRPPSGESVERGGSGSYSPPGHVPEVPTEDGKVTLETAVDRTLDKSWLV